MLAIEGRESTSSRTVVALSHSKMEMGNSFNAFIIGFPLMVRKHDPIMVVVEKISKETHFILVNSNYKPSDIEIIFMK